MRTAWARFRADLVCLGLLLILALVFFWPVTFGLGFVPRGGGDLASFLWPTYSYAAGAYTSGRVPLWNPTLYAGMPFAADPQTAAFYPLNLVVYFVAPGFPYAALEALVIAHVWLSGVGLYALLRIWLGADSERVAALTGAVALMFCDVTVIHIGNYNIVAAASWLPFALAGLHRALSGGGSGARTGAAAALALSVLAGHAQLTLMVWSATAAYGLWAALAESRAAPREAGRRLLVTGQVVGVAVLLAAIAWLPALELQRYTARAALTYEQATEFSLPWAGLAGLFSPLLLGRGSQDFWAPWPRVESGYVGVATLLLAGFALARRPTRLTVYLALLGALAMALALGPNTPLHRWIFDAVGVFRGLRVPARFVYLTDFALAALAGVGMQALAARTDRRWLLNAAFWAALGAIAMSAGYRAAAATAAPLRDPIWAAGIAAGLLLAVAIVGWLGRSRAGAVARWAAWLILAADLIGHGAWVETDGGDPTVGFQHTVANQFLQGRPTPTRVDNASVALAPDAGARLGFDDIGGIYNPLGLATMQTYRDALGSRGSARYDFLGAQWVVADKNQPPADDVDIVPVFIDDPALDVYLNNAAQPRVSLRRRADVVAEGQALDRLLAADFDLATSVVIEPVAASPEGVTGAEVPPRLVESTGGEGGRILLEAYGPEHIRIRVTTDGPRWLVIADAWYPGWRATLDGAPVSVFRANLAFRAVAIESGGEHVIDLVFLPATQQLGAVLSVIGLMVVAGDLGLAAWRRRLALANLRP